MSKILYHALAFCLFYPSQCPHDIHTWHEQSLHGDHTEKANNQKSLKFCFFHNPSP